MRFQTALSKMFASVVAMILPVMGLAQTAPDQGVVIAEEVTLKPSGQTVLPLDAEMAEALPAQITSAQAVVITFNNLELASVARTYYEVYLVTNSENGGVGRYVGNLTFFGVDDAQDEGAPNQSIDVTTTYADLGFAQNGVGVMLRPVSYDQAQPQIGSVNLHIVELAQN